MDVPRPRLRLRDASEAYRSGLRAAGVPVSWTPLGWPSTSWRAAFGPMDARVGEYGTVVVQSTPWWHERLAAESEGRLLARRLVAAPAGGAVGQGARAARRRAAPARV